MNYYEKLKDPRWQKLRLEVMQRDKFSCVHCGDKSATLNVHHLAYHKSPWDSPPEELITLCEQCHENVERLKLMVGRALALSSVAECFRSLCLLCDSEILGFEGAHNNAISALKILKNLKEPSFFKSVELLCYWKEQKDNPS